MDTKTRFAARLKQLRESAGMTQQQLADVAGVKLGGLRDLEQGKNGPTWETVLALAAALGVDCTAFTEEPGTEAAEPRKPGRPRKTPEAAEDPPPPPVEASEPAAGEPTPAKKKPRKRGKQP